jgi:hypothetical protein
LDNRIVKTLGRRYRLQNELKPQSRRNKAPVFGDLERATCNQRIQRTARAV